MAKRINPLTLTTQCGRLTSKNLLPTFHILNSNVRQKFGRKPGGKIEDLDVNTSIWGIFLTVTLRAAVHLGNDYVETLHSTKNRSMRALKQLFNVTGKLIKDQDEISRYNIQLSTAKTYVFSDSVLCVGGNSLQYRELDRIDRWSSSGKFHRIRYIADPR